ncbi:uncharacterized protein MKZ38_008247 [Zalerion maritima]|uniref:LTD domain-containing protein n=1 Tax=Zalerion maritima TaxID=339359 RepID=A0AAD5RV30_9PEZI|nr:uncharacterized protein MKZ38_008247 [Zalerion maritima]
MGLSEPYGVWACKPLRLDLDDDSNPHIHLYYTDAAKGDNPSRPYRVSINVRSASAGEKRLAYWSNPNFIHPLTSRVPQDLKFHEIPSPSVSGTASAGGFALDYLRDNILTLSEGKLLEYQVPGDDNDLVDHIWGILKQAIADNSKVYLWGEQFDDKTGIHQIHMNQGNLAPYNRENGTWQDGGFMVQNKDPSAGGGRAWHAVFLAFGVQVPDTTYPDGEPAAGAKNLSRLLEPNGPAHPGPGPGPGPVPEPLPLPNLPHRLEIVACLANPVGRDGIDNPEIVTVQNPSTAAESIVLRGWSITNKFNDRSLVPDGVVLGPGEPCSFAVSPLCPLSNKGSSITLWSPNGHAVDIVSYKSGDAQSGKVIKFE